MNKTFNPKFTRIVGSSNYSEMQSLFQDEQAMKTFKGGKIWSDEKIHKYLAYFEKEGPRSKYIDWKISCRNQIVGLVGVEPTFPQMGSKYKGRFMLSILIRSKFWGQGYGKAGLLNGISRFRLLFPKESAVYALININNLRALNLMKNCGFQIDQKLGYNLVIYKLILTNSN